MEALVAVVLLGIGIAASMAAFSSISRTQTRLQETERMEALAWAKLDELLATGEAFGGNTEAEFPDAGAEGYRYQVATQASGTESLEVVTLTVSKGEREVKVSTLAYRPLETGGAGGTTP